jgi:anti-anti-sigma factor
MADLDVGRIVVDELDSSVWVVELGGEHDLSTVGELHSTLEAIFARGTTIVLDLSQTTFIDSSVLSELIVAQERADGNPDEHLAIVAPQEGNAARLIGLVDAARLFSLYETRAEALESV